MAQENITQSELATLADISKTTVNLILNEKYNPSLELMSLIASTLSVPLPVLLTDSESDSTFLKKTLPNGKMIITATVTKLQAFQIEKWHNVLANTH